MEDFPTSQRPERARPRGSRLTSPTVLILFALLACGGSVGLQLFLKKRAEDKMAQEAADLPRTEVVQLETRRFQVAPEPERRTLYVRGFAENSEGTALPSAHIRLGLLQGDHWTQLEHFEPEVNGSFEINLDELSEWSPHSLNGVRLEARASAPNHQPLRVRASIPREGNEVQMNLPFQAGHTLAGQVVDAQGLPVANASVDIFLSTPTDSPNSERKRSVATDSEGRFLCGWPLGSNPQTIDAKHPHFGKRTIFLDGLAPNADHDLDAPIQLNPGKILSGVVSCPNGDLLPDIRIVARKASDPQGVSGRASRRSVLTGANGAFHFTELEHEKYVLVVEDASHPVGPFTIGTTDIALEIEAPRLVVNVQDSTGRALPGAPLEFVNISSRGANRSPLFETTEHKAKGSDGTITFAPAQRFAGQAPDSALSLAVVLRGGASNLPPFEQSIDIPADACLIDTTFRYLPEASYGELRVRLADPRGGWVSDPQVTVTSALSQRSYEALGDIDPEPEAWATAIPPGDYTLIAEPVATYHDHGHLLPTPSPEDVHVNSGGGADLDLTANLGGRVELVLTLREKPATSSAPRVRGIIPNARVRCTSLDPGTGRDPRRELLFIAGDETLAEIPVEGTHLAAEALPPGTYNLKIYGNGLTTTNAKVEVRAGETAVVRVEVPER